VVVRDGEAQNGLDFELTKGTLLRGRITEGPDHRAVAGAPMLLVEQGGLLPRDYRGVIGDRFQLSRSTTTADSEGRYQFRVGPSNYMITSMNPKTRQSESAKMSVSAEPEVTLDLTLAESPRETIFKGVVVANTPAGERPVAKVRILVSPPGARATSDDQGRFEIARKPGSITMFAYIEDQGLGGFTTFPADAQSGKVLIWKGASITGRIVDTDGKPQSMHRIGMRLSPLHDRETYVGIAFRCDAQGRFAFPCAPLESEGELSAPHLKDSNGKPTTARTVLQFEVEGPETVEVPDLVVPAERPARQP
jgi:hypothetical protein